MAQVRTVGAAILGLWDRHTVKQGARARARNKELIRKLQATNRLNDDGTVRPVGTAGR